jgi:hypothetical protein
VSGNLAEECPPDRVSRQFARRAFGGLFITVLAIVVLTFRDYGITWDEQIQSRYGETLLRWYRTLGRDDTATHFGNLYLYGGFFETLAESVARFFPRAHFEARHLVGALFGALAFPAAYGAGLRLGGPLAGLLSAVLLALNPPFYGHLFANSKDTPFAASFMVALFLMLDSLRTLDASDRRASLRLGLAIGVAAGIRVWGLALLGLLAILWAAWVLLTPRTPGSSSLAASLRRTASSFGLVTLVAWLTMLCAWPWASLSPLSGPLRALFATATLRPDMTFLFRGQVVSAAALPRDYALTWFLITLPEVHLIGLSLAILLGVSWLLSKRPLKSKAVGLEALPVAWFGLVAVSPLLLVVIARPFLYDGVRHLLFLVPPLCVIAGVALSALIQGSFTRGVKALVVTAAVASGLATIGDMASLHPYQTVYFNRAVAGGLPRAAEGYETDYWGSTYKEGVEWLVRHYDPPSGRRVRLALVGGAHQLTYYLQRIDPGRRFEVREPDNDPHVLLINRNLNRFRRIKGKLLHTIDRQGTPLLFIFEIRKPRVAAPEDSPSG